MDFLHIFAESSAIGDTALNLCRYHVAMINRGYEKIIIHTTPYIHANGLKITSNPIVYKIWEKTNFVQEVVMDVEHGDKESFIFSKKYNQPILHSFEYRDYNDIKQLVDLKEYTPEINIQKRTVLFQPVSLKTKPKEFLDEYIPVWDRCLKTLLDKEYEIIMVGAEDDPVELCFNKKFLSKINNKIGEWSILESLAFNIYKADIVVSCDSWAGLWGVAARKPTAIAWGHRMEQNIDFWATEFLGNKDCYKYGWSSQKEYCDALLASYLDKIKL
jgi:hypothetical protein